MTSFKNNFKKLFLLGSILGCFFSTLSAQFKLDVEGDTKFLGKIELINAVNDSSVLIGANAGINILNNGKIKNNTFIGNNAGLLTTSGLNNVFLGHNAGKGNLTGTSNVFLGNGAGANNAGGDQNTFVGISAGNMNTGGGNTFVGYQVGIINSSGRHNTFTGTYAGGKNSTGEKNTMMGYNTGHNITTGSENVFIGEDAGRVMLGSNRNTMIGTNTGPNDMGGPDSLDRAIAIGYNAKVNCHNCAVIGGTGVDAVKVGIGTEDPIYTLDIQHESIAPITAPGHGLNLKNLGGNNNEWQLFVGNINGKLRLYKNEVLMGTFDQVSGNYTPNSDKRLKNNIRTLKNQLSLIQRLRPTTYHFNGRSAKRKVYGLIAQEVQKVIPDIVLENDGDNEEQKTLGISYTELIPVLIAGIQEQQAIIQKQNEDNQTQQKQLANLTEKFNNQETAINQLKELVQQLADKPSKKSAIPHLHQYQLSLKKQAGLSQNQPNPFYQNTTIHYFIPENTKDAYLQVTSLSGTEIGKTPILETGNGQITIQTENYPIGTYYYSLVVDGKVVETKKMILIK